MMGGDVELNGVELKLAGENLPAIKGTRASKGKIELEGKSINFLAFASAGNRACR
jgi:hypothetical protein